MDVIAELENLRMDCHNRHCEYDEELHNAILNNIIAYIKTGDEKKMEEHSMIIGTMELLNALIKIRDLLYSIEGYNEMIIAEVDAIMPLADGNKHLVTEEHFLTLQTICREMMIRTPHITSFNYSIRDEGMYEIQFREDT